MTRIGKKSCLQVAPFDPDEASMGGPVAGVKAITTMLVVAVLNISLKLWTTHPLPYPAGVFIAHKLLYI